MSRPTRRANSATRGAPRVNVFDSGLGWVATAWRGERLYALAFGHRTPQRALAALGLPADEFTVDPASGADAFSGRVQAYADGRADDFRDVPVDLDDFSDFQRRVFSALPANCVTARRWPTGNWPPRSDRRERLVPWAAPWRAIAFRW